MPYFIQKRGGQHCVIKGTKKDPGEVKKCHPKRQDALDHLAALYVNVEDAGRDKAATAPGSTSNLPHGQGGTLGSTASRLGNDKKPKQKPKTCVCPKCGAKKTAPAGKPCLEIKCPKCGAKMEGRSGAGGDKDKKSASIKMLDDGRLGGYLIYWGSEEERDLMDEYFTAKTDFWLDKWTRRPLIYQHGLDHTGTLKGADAVVGVVDQYQPDDIGLWIEAQLNLRHRYKDAIAHLVAESALNLSSGALPRFVERSADGFIKTWPIVEVTLTPTPAEFRLADVVQVKAAFETIGEDFDKEVNMNEGTFWNKLGERLGFIKSDADDEEVTTEEMEVTDEAATDETPQQTTQASALPAEEDQEEKDKGEKKSTSLPEVIVDEVVIKAISNRVVTAMTSSLAEVVAPIQQEVEELKAWREKVTARLDATEKSIEEKAAEWVAGLPPIVRVRATEVKTTETSETSEVALTPREKRSKEWQNTFASIIDTALKTGETIGSMEEV